MVVKREVMGISPFAREHHEQAWISPVSSLYIDVIRLLFGGNDTDDNES